MVRTNDPEVVWDEPNKVDDKWIQFIDDNVLASALPPRFYRAFAEALDNCRAPRRDQSPGNYSLRIQLLDKGSGNLYRATRWVQIVILPQVLSYKVTLIEAMVSGEFFSQSTLYAAVPDFTPKPYAWGTYAADSSIHFFLCAFVDMDEVTLPDPQKFARGLAKLHMTTESPTGKYGFSVATLQGLVPQFVKWTDTWEEFFSRSFRRLVENEEKAQGPDPIMRQLEEAIFKKVIPRLLRPLETGGRSIRPCLVHGDTWDGNVATDLDTNSPIIFDSTCIYAHNEFELAALRPARHRMRKEYREAYLREVHPSEPGEDHDDRNALYCLRFDMNSSSIYPGRPRWRKICIETMQYLVAKYPEGYEGWAKERGEEPAQGYNK